MKYKAVELKDYIKQNKRPVQLSNMDAKAGFTFEDEKLLAIRKKIEQHGIVLGEVEGIEVARGLYTGCNVGFIIDEQTANHIINKEPSSKKHIYRYIRGKNIKSYSIDASKQEYVINVQKGWTNNNRGNTEAEEYFMSNHPSIYNYIKNIADGILDKKIKVKGVGIYNRGNMGDYWWECQSFKYTGKEKKVLIPDIQEGSSCVYDEELMWDSTIYAIVGEISKELTGIINSKIVRKINDKFYSTSKLGEALRWKKEAIVRIFIPQNIENKKLEKLVDQIQQLKKENKPTDHLEAKVEKIVQELYGLTDEEVEYLCE